MIRSEEMGLQDYVAILRRRWWIVTSLAVAGAVLGFGIALVIPKKYTSQTVVLVEQPRVPESVVKSVISEDLNHRLASMQEQILSRTRLEPIIDRFGLFAVDVRRVPKGDLIDRLRKAISVTPIAAMQGTEDRRLPGFSVSVALDNPLLAQQVCSEITSMFMQQNLQRREQQAVDTTDFLTQQLEESRAKLDAQDARLAVFKTRYLGALPDEEQTNLSLLSGLNTQLEAATQALSRAQQDKAFAESLLAQQEAAKKSSQSGQNPQTLEEQLAVTQQQLLTLQSRYTAKHPDVIKMKKDIEQLKEQIAAANDPANNETKSNSQLSVEPAQIQQLRAQLHQNDVTIQGLTKRQEQLEEQIHVTQGRVQSSPLVEQQYKELTRNYQVALESYNDLLKKRDQSAMSSDLERRQQSEQFRVLDPPDMPSRPSFPDWRLFTAGGFGAGLLFGMGLGFAFETNDKTLRTEREIEIFLKEPTLAVIPVIGDFRENNRRPKRKGGSTPELVARA
jgi:polysaccharide chain length determinant protein (PEP-CTERM system associated)